MSSTAERTMLREPVRLVDQGAARPVAHQGNLDLIATPLPGTAPSREGVLSQTSSALASPASDKQPARPGGGQRAGASPLAREAARPAQADAGAAEGQTAQRVTASSDSDEHGTATNGGQPVISIFEPHLLPPGETPPPPGGERNEVTGFSDPDPLYGPRMSLMTYVSKDGVQTVRSRGIAEQLMQKEQIALERKLALKEIPQEESSEYQAVNERLAALRSANQDQFTDGTEYDEYVATISAGTTALEIYARALPDTTSETANVPGGRHRLIRMCDTQIAAARAAQFDIQRLMEHAADEAEAQRPPQEFGKKGKEGREDDIKTLYRQAEALVRQRKDDVERDPVVVDSKNGNNGLASIEETGQLSFGPIEVAHSDGTIGYNAVTITTKVIHPYGRQPTEEYIPDQNAPSALRITGIQITTQDNQAIEFKLRKIAKNGELEVAIEPVQEGEKTTTFDGKRRGRGILFSDDFPTSHRNKLNDVLAALSGNSVTAGNA